ncbi:unnamed protein product [Prorocentrum cordatum]|uniref:Sodium/calcium exchanger membrane region domain-containing protein n=1 Tax=Prorocentrum cordatum TaxID=2364126 RepID=A0ABN9TNL6_9DINO|nr:unnamed protein product [Polarella glacialis]
MTPPAARTALGSLLGALLLVPTVVFVLLIPSLGWAQEPCARPEGADSDSLFDYLAFYSCAGALPTPLRGVLLLVWLVLLISLLASTADMFFVPQLEAMCQRLGLPDDVAGVTLLALGNGMPDVMTATSSINNASEYHEARRLLADKEFLKANCRVPASLDTGRPSSKDKNSEERKREEEQDRRRRNCSTSRSARRSRRRPWTRPKGGAAWPPRSDPGQRVSRWAVCAPPRRATVGASPSRRW